MSIRIEGAVTTSAEPIKKQPEPLPAAMQQTAEPQFGNNRIGELNQSASMRRAEIGAMEFTPVRKEPPPPPPPLLASLSEALRRIEELPVPTYGSTPRNLPPEDRQAVYESRLRAYNQERAAIADAAVQNAKPPVLEDFQQGGLNRATAEYEYREAKAAYESQKAELSRISAEAKANPTEPPAEPVAEPVTATVSYERFDETLDFMHDEMITNLGSETVANIRAQLEYADFLMNPDGIGERIAAGLAQAGGDSPANHINAALAAWALKVRPGGDWDHKPELRERLGLDQKGEDDYFPIRGDSSHEVYYDVWSNIHYGYVGRAAGFDAQTLQEGAALADGLAGRNDPVDVLTVQIGIDLWNKYGDSMTQAQLHRELLSRMPDIMRAQETPEYIEANPDFRHIIDVEDGNGR